MYEAGERTHRKTRIDKRFHVNPGLDQDTHHKLERMAIACSMRKTALAEEILRVSLNNASFINYLQEIHKASEFRVIPVNRPNGTLDY